MKQGGSAKNAERKTAVRYVFMDPAGNRTILVETPVPPEAQPDIAAGLMKLEPSAEQVGFISIFENGVNESAAGAAGTGAEIAPGKDAVSCDLSLRMAGGEFCGNASMSAAVLYLLRGGRMRGRAVMRVSGAKEPVRAEIAALEDGLWQGLVEMPGPGSIDTVRFPDGQELPVVSFPGISHVIVEQAMEAEEAEELVKTGCGFLEADALGLLFLDREAGSLTPLVYVPAADTLFWESACGSGTAAVGAWLAREQGRPVTLSLHQPGGMLEISASPEGPLYLKGKVRCLYERTAVITPE